MNTEIHLGRQGAAFVRYKPHDRVWLQWLSLIFSGMNKVLVSIYLLNSCLKVRITEFAQLPDRGLRVYFGQFATADLFICHIELEFSKHLLQPPSKLVIVLIVGLQQLLIT